jgi:hypothetical protein
MPLNNFSKIRSLLSFSNSDQFYFIQVLQRKKDHQSGKINGTNNNSRLIKYYLVDNLEYFDFIQPEIEQLCDVFQARAGINLNRRSYRKMALQNLKKCTDQIINEDFNHAHKAYASVVGSFNHDSDKRWILDVDEVGRPTNDIVLFAERECAPEGDKFISIIPSKNGYHIIMKPFDLNKFRKQFPDIEVHKNNPTNLYIP